MTPGLTKLVEIGSSPILEKLGDSDLRLVPDGLRALYEEKNGFYAFESALHVFPIGTRSGVMDLHRWNEANLWRNAFGPLIEDDWTFFAEDVFGGQFVIGHGGTRISTFDPETGAIESLAGSIDEWAEKVLADHRFLTGYPLAHDWQSLNGPLAAGTRLRPKTPFALQGDYSVSNLYAGEAVEGMRFGGHLAQQIKDLPPGATVTLKVVD